jgi:hypothetical protein
MKDASSKMILSSDELSVIFHRICCQLIEEHEDFKSSALIGLQPRGVTFARRYPADPEGILWHKGPSIRRIGHYLFSGRF